VIYLVDDPRECCFFFNVYKQVFKERFNGSWISVGGSSILDIMLAFLRKKSKWKKHNLCYKQDDNIFPPSPSNNNLVKYQSIV